MIKRVNEWKLVTDRPREKLRKDENIKSGRIRENWRSEISEGRQRVVRSEVQKAKRHKNVIIKVI